MQPDDDLAADDTAARAALLVRLDETTTAPAVFVLPLHCREDGNSWASAD